MTQDILGVVSLAGKVKYDCYSEIKTITSDLQSLDNKITSNQQEISGLYELLRDRTPGSDIQPLLDYYIMRATDFSEGQNQLCRGLRNLLDSIAYPFLESTYMLKLYECDQDDDEAARVKAKKYVMRAKRVISLIKRAMEFPHNKAEQVCDWCYKFGLALRGTDALLEEMACEVYKEIGCKSNAALRFNEDKKNCYKKLAIKPPKEVSQVSNDNRKGIFGDPQGDVRMAIDSTGVNQGDADTINMQVNIGTALSELCEILQNKNVPKHDITEIQAEEANLKNPDPEVRKTALEKVWGKVKSMATIVNESEDIVKAVKTLVEAAGLAVIGL